MQNSLNTISSGGTQSTTESPQSATSDNSLNPSTESSLQSSSVNLSNGSNGVSLHPTSLSTVSLGSTHSSSVTEPKSVIVVKHHHINGVLLGIVAAVLVVAIVSFVQTSKSAKSTTE